MKIALRRVARATPGAGNAQFAWPERHVVIVRLDDERGACGCGEAAPLPSYSLDTLDGAEHALHAVRAADIEAALDGDDTWVALDRIAMLVPAAQAAARFALECAALDLIGQRTQVPAPVLLGAHPHTTRALAALIGAAGDAGLIAAASRAFDAGYRCFKIKVGEIGAMAAEVDGLSGLRARLGAQVHLRIDANRALPAAIAMDFCRAIAPLSIELFEEPCAQPWPPLATAVPLALDESLQGVVPADLGRLVAASGARCIVLKPMALGGLSHCRTLAACARASGVEAIVSHLFDGPLAWRACAALALALEVRVAQGLAPHAGLHGWEPDAGALGAGVLRGWQAPGLGVDERCLN